MLYKQLPRIRVSSLNHVRFSNFWNRNFSTNPNFNAIHLKNVAQLQRPELDFDFLLNPANTKTIKSNIKNRKQNGNIDQVLAKWHQIEKTETEPQSSFYLSELWNELYEAAFSIPNETSNQTPIGDKSMAKTVFVNKEKQDISHVKNIRLAEEILIGQGTLRADITNECGEKSYALFDRAAILEQCVIDYTIDRLIQEFGFKFVIVPDVLNINTPKSCGMITETETRKYVYTLNNNPEYCLSGTGEMGLASMIKNEIFNIDQLPLKLCTLSRCYRPEVASVGQERLLYRVHEFSKVEMFALTANETGQESEEMLQHFVDIQQTLFSTLGLHYRLLDMPSQELGAPAFRKFDIEAWMPGRQAYGEISSASNCTAYQTRRLLTKYFDGRQSAQSNAKFAHTVNGTACATTRLLIALIEQRQTDRGRLKMPDCLQPYLEKFEISKKKRMMKIRKC